MNTVELKLNIFEELIISGLGPRHVRASQDAETGLWAGAIYPSLNAQKPFIDTSNVFKSKRGARAFMFRLIAECKKIRAAEGAPA